MGLFPEAVPSPRKTRINKWELELPRSLTGNPEPTIDTLGVGGKSQGRHYNYIKLDDIYGDKARDSEAESATTKEWFDNIQSFFSTFLKDKLDLTGTRYDLDDVYAHAEERYGTQLVKYSERLRNLILRTREDDHHLP
jgi:phosphopentomutase